MENDRSLEGLEKIRWHFKIGVLMSEPRPMVYRYVIVILICSERYTKAIPIFI